MSATRFEWLNPPPDWRAEGATLRITTGDRTDFWRDTFYGFTRHSGHAWLAPVEADFTLVARFRGQYEALYDQAGLLLRTDETRWIKTGIEFTDGLLHFSVVVTGPRSDWSVIPLPGVPADTEIRARITRHGDAARIDHAIGDGPWRLARLAPCAAGPARAGVTACSPERAGFVAEFTDITLGPPIPRALHTDPPE